MYLLYSMQPVYINIEMWTKQRMEASIITMESNNDST